MKPRVLFVAILLLCLFALPVSAQDTSTVYLPFMSSPGGTLSADAIPTPAPPDVEIVLTDAEIEAMAGEAVFTEAPDRALGATLHIAGRNLKLPDNAAIVQEHAVKLCLAAKDATPIDGVAACHDEPTVIVEQDGARIEIGTESGKVLGEYGKEGKRESIPAFDFLRTWLRELPPQSQRQNAAPTDQVGAASISDPIFLAESPLCQHATAPRTENCVGFYWGIYVTPQTVYWRADAPIRGYALGAINVWKVILPHLKWTEGGRGTSNQPDIEFKAANCAGDSQYVLACMQYKAWVGQGTPDASYWRRAHIYFNRFPPGGLFIPEPVKTVVIMHEIGHLLGLADRYFMGGCNPFEQTLMDSFFYDQSQNVLHCDSLTAPASLDIGRLDTFWGKGHAGALTIFPISNNIHAIYINNVWAGKYHLLRLFRKVNGQWQPQYTLYNYARMGVHYTVEQRQIEFNMNPASYGMPHGYQYMVCDYPWLPGKQKYGQWLCSNAINW